MGLRLTYLDLMGVVDVDYLPPQPVRVQGKGNTRPTRLVPVHKDYNQVEPCAGCVACNAMIDRAFRDNPRPTRTYDCFALPDCDGAIFVRATPENKLRYIQWRLEHDK